MACSISRATSAAFEMSISPRTRTTDRWWEHSASFRASSPTSGLLLEHRPGQPPAHPYDRPPGIALDVDLVHEPAHQHESPSAFLAEGPAPRALVGDRDGDRVLFQPDAQRARPVH